MSLEDEDIDSIKDLTDRISFRLLATKNHGDYKWLYALLEDYMNKQRKN